jgi:hypothetical protein
VAAERRVPLLDLAAEQLFQQHLRRLLAAALVLVAAVRCARVRVFVSGCRVCNSITRNTDLCLHY